MRNPICSDNHDADLKYDEYQQGNLEHNNSSPDYAESYHFIHWPVNHSRCVILLSHDDQDYHNAGGSSHYYHLAVYQIARDVTCDHNDGAYHDASASGHYLVIHHVTQDDKSAHDSCNRNVSSDHRHSRPRVINCAHHNDHLEYNDHDHPLDYHVHNHLLGFGVDHDKRFRCQPLDFDHLIFDYLVFDHLVFGYLDFDHFVFDHLLDDDEQHPEYDSSILLVGPSDIAVS
ncbi:hypothetical protein CAC42_5854 [Sphaceloma murrayae]|uniref:Uncharacterized protein n=1 Tax=Sphaceloma murrayae TaxID=2082308 RepID=A0A2K1QZC7_9PEZI|nr:hypothetical protein CAC42_5854 [Sphaceloma murrayae]